MHREYSQLNPLGVRCSCGINRDHTIHDFYDLMDGPHPSVAHLYPHLETRPRNNT